MRILLRTLILRKSCSSSLTGSGAAATTPLPHASRACRHVNRIAVQTDCARPRQRSAIQRCPGGERDGRLRHDVSANVVLVPRVAELPTCQNTFFDRPPPLIMTWLFPAAVVSVDWIWKIHTPAALPLSARLPVIPSEGCALVVLYTPGASVSPPMSAGRTAPPAAAAALLYAVVKSPCAVMATASPRCSVPVNVPGGNPVMEAAGHIPISPPLTIVGPTLLTTGVAPRIPKLQAVPNGETPGGGGGAHVGEVVNVHTKF